MTQRKALNERSFLLFQQEGYLMKSTLTSGLTAARRANVHDKGAAYVALFNLATGFERLFKSVIVADHMATHGLVAPSQKQLKDYGHNLCQLYDACILIAAKYGYKIPSRIQFDALDNGLVDLLSDFGKGDRYHNFNQLGGSQSSSDPLAGWAKILRLALNEVPEKTRSRIREDAKSIASRMQDLTLVLMDGLDGRPLTLVDALAQPELDKLAASHIVWRVSRIIDSFVPILDSACSAVNRMSQSAVLPVAMREFFEWLYADRAYVLRKKKWP